ncbi:MAG: anaerobic sulfatase maturase, partial [Clostridiales bacterium]|nr:anaerobic sulfatase maturase [Clostridiales bacterium]
MKNVNLLIKPASSLCNLRCEYCFYEDEAQNRTQRSMGVMKE